MRDGVKWITDVREFSEIAAAWERLAAADAVPFSDPRWYASWYFAFGAPRTPAVCTVWEAGELVAALPLLSERGRLEAMANEHTPRFRAAARDGEALERVVRAALPARADVLEVRALAVGDPLLARLETAAAAGGHRLLTEPEFTSPVVAAEGDFAAYRESRKKRWREIERRRRKLEREHAVEVTLLASPDDLERDLDEALAVEGSGWKGREGTAIASSERTAAFYRAMARAFGLTGELRLSLLRVDGRVAAMDLALVRHRGYFLLKTGYDEALRSLAPGLALRLLVVEACFGAGLDHEFLGGDMEYKRLFATGERHHVTARLYAPTARGAARHAYRASARPLLKRAYRAVVPVPKP